MPEISAEKISYVITKARELANGDGKPEAGRAGPSGRGAVKVGGAPCAKAQAELAIFIEAMAEDEQCELVALAWIGRGVFTREEWASAVVEAVSASCAQQRLNFCPLPHGHRAFRVLTLTTTTLRPTPDVKDAHRRRRR